MDHPNDEKGGHLNKDHPNDIKKVKMIKVGT